LSSHNIPPKDLLTEHKEAFRIIHERGPVCVLTGAGVSVDSGIPTFRGTDGLWRQYPPSLFGHTPGLIFTFACFPKWFQSFLRDTIKTFVQATPNDTHTLLATLEQQGLLSGIITQNVDQLHQDAGSQHVVEVHGNFFRSVCKTCKRQDTLSKDALRAFLNELEGQPLGRIKLFKKLKQDLFTCPSCGGARRPDMVFFGDPLDTSTWQEAICLVKHNKVMLVLGTSATVYPVAELPHIAREAGATLIEINPTPTALTPFVDLYIPDTSSRALRLLVDDERHC